MTTTECTTIGVVAIGRNEGERLRACLQSIPADVKHVVYVDSGSSDDSVHVASELGAEVVELDMNMPFTAARARNAGIARLKEVAPDVQLVQVVDGDCVIVDGWLMKASKTLETDEQLGVVCGRRRERFPDASVYNKLCDMEWDTPVGEANACGGDAMIRVVAFGQVDGYDETLIAGEEPEMCLRLRRAGWNILRIDADMTMHDAAMTTLGQWWKRMVRSGHAYAEGRARHGRSPDRYCVHEIRSIIEWALLLPLLAFGAAWFTWGASFALFGGYFYLANRVKQHRMDQGDSHDDAAMYARYCVLGKFAQLQGATQFWLNQLLGRRSTIIEYKSSPATEVERAPEAIRP